MTTAKKLNMTDKICLQFFHTQYPQKWFNLSFFVPMLPHRKVSNYVKNFIVTTPSTSGAHFKGQQPEEQKMREKKSRYILFFATHYLGLEQFRTKTKRRFGNRIECRDVQSKKRQ